MRVRICTECGKHNSEIAWSCAHCGAALSVDTITEVDPNVQEQISNDRNNAQMARSDVPNEAAEIDGRSSGVHPSDSETGAPVKKGIMRVKKRYALERSGPKRLEINWRRFDWDEFQISLDNTVIASGLDKGAMEEGRAFFLQDGSTLKIQLLKGRDLRVLRDGKLLPDPAANPTWLGAAVGVIFVISISNFFNILSSGLNVDAILFGPVFLILGLFARKRSLPALVVASGLWAYAIGTIILWAINHPDSTGIFIGYLIYCAAIEWIIVRGLIEMRRLRIEGLV